MEERLPFRLTLASASPARRYVLSRAGYEFDVRPAHIDEPTDAGYVDCRSLVEHIAWLKAAAVAAQVESGWILAADTVGWFQGQAIGKPADVDDARRILRLLRGTEHELWTGVCLWRRPDNLQVAFQELSTVAMAAMSDADVETYLRGGAWEGNSGAYAIREDGGDPLVQVRSGSLTNVIGLPMETLEDLLPRLKHI